MSKTGGLNYVKNITVNYVKFVSIVRTMPFKFVNIEQNSKNMNVEAGNIIQIYRDKHMEVENHGICI